MINMTDLINQPPKKDFTFLIRFVAVFAVGCFCVSVLQSCGSINLGQPAPTHLREIQSIDCQPETNFQWGTLTHSPVEKPVVVQQAGPWTISTPTPSPSPSPVRHTTPHRIQFHIHTLPALNPPGVDTAYLQQ